MRALRTAVWGAASWAVWGAVWGAAWGMPVTAGGTDLLTQEEYDGLRDIYDTTNGPYWSWSEDTAQDGASWEFDDYENNNPCSTPWQGLICYKSTSGSCDANGCHLLGLNLTSYNLSGTLSSLAGKFPALQYLYMANNNLTGLLPPLTGMPELLIINMSYNALRGPVPDTFDDMAVLDLLYLSNNLFTGTLPPSLFHLPKLRYLSLYNNSIDGTVCENVTSMSSIFYLNFAHNEFRGSLPTGLLSMANLSQVLFSYNRFSGSLPTDVGASLQVLRVSNNDLSGTIPESLCRSTGLEFVSLFENRFRGHLPSCIGQLAQLQIFLVQTNAFSGSIDGLFNASVQRNLQLVDISDNAFTGRLSPDLLVLPQIQSIAAGENCFHGSLPASICQAGPLLKTLALDGLGASEACVNKLWDPLGLSQAEFGGLMEGTIPDCIWSLGNITVVHLAGNGFTGSLPSFDSCTGSCGPSPTLSDVTLTHNRLTGTIPQAFQRFPFRSLDLSSNKFKGDVQAMTNLNFSYSPTVAGASLILENNRLTGKLPSSYEDAYNVNILQGNLFKCRSGQRALVKHDHNSQTAVCGSQQLNSAGAVFFFYVLGAALVIAGMAAFKVAIRRNCDRLVQAIRAFLYAMQYVQRVSSYPIPSEEDLARILHRSQIGNTESDLVQLYHERIQSYANVYQFLSSLTLIQRLSWLVASYSLVVCLPIYVGVYLGDERYSTHADRYGWVSSAVFISGELPAGLLFCVWTLLIVLVLHLIMRHFNLQHSAAHPEGWLTRAWRWLRPNSQSRLRDPKLSNYAPVGHREDDSADVAEAPIPVDVAEASDLETPILPYFESLRLDSLLPIDPPVRSSVRRPSTKSISERISIRELVLSDEAQSYWRNTFKYGLVFVTNTAVALSINAAYLITQNATNLTTDFKMTIQVLMAMFKIFWNIIALRLLMNYLPYKRTSVMLHVGMLVFNSIFAPCIATALTDTSCLRESFVAPPSITVGYSLTTCIESYQQVDSVTHAISTVCTHYQDNTLLTTFTPTFIYYYTCGSKLLTTYAPLYLYIYTMLLTMFPLTYLFLSTSSRKWWPSVLIPFVDGALRPGDKGEVHFEKLVRASSMQAIMAHHLVVLLTFGVCVPLLGIVIALSLTVDTFMWQVILTRYIKFDSKDTPFSKSYCPLRTARSSVRDSRTGMLSSLKTAEEDAIQLRKTESDGEDALLGIDIPLSHSRGTLDANDTLFQLLLEQYSYPGGVSGHGMALNVDLVKEEARLYELHTVCGEAWKSLRGVVWLMIYCTMFFYACVLFDLAGDRGGWKQALWVLICCFVVALILRNSYKRFFVFLHETVLGGYKYIKVQVQGEF